MSPLSVLHLSGTISSILHVLGSWMKFFALVLAGLAALTIRPVYAESRTPPEATQHAIEELQNAIAQGRITLTPTLTATPPPSATPSPTVSPVVTEAPTTVPIATPQPQPCWQTDELGEVVFDEDGAPVPCPLEVAQVLPSGGPPDDGLAIDPNAPPVELVPPPADPNNPGAQPSPIVIVIIATAAPVPTLPPQVIYQTLPPPEAVPTPSPAQVIYLVVTPTPAGAAIAEPTPSGATLPAVTPTAATPATEQDGRAMPEASAASDDATPQPVTDSQESPLTPDRVPPPMLASFGLWAGMRRRVQEDTDPWLPVLS